MLSNRQLLSKREAIAKMVALPNIVLSAQEADRFIDYIVDQSRLKNTARIVRMNKPTKNIRALGIGTTAFLHPGATFTSSNYLRTLVDQKIELVSKKVRGCVVIHDDDLEDNIEADGFADHVMRMVAARIANELEEAMYIGDTHGLGSFADTDIRSLWDGWRYRIMHASVSGDSYYNSVSGAPVIITARSEDAAATSTEYSAGDIVRPATANGYIYICQTAGTSSASAPTWPTVIGTTVVDGTVTWRCYGYDCDIAGGIAAQNTSAPYNWEFKYQRMLKRLPSIYKTAGLGNLRFLHSDQVTQDYVNALAARSTILGDQAIMGAAPLQFGKVPLIDCPLMPTTLDEDGVIDSGSYTDTILTPKGNLIIGIQRELKIESQRIAADESTYWFYSMRADVAIENVNAAVMLMNLTID